MAGRQPLGKHRIERAVSGGGDSVERRRDSPRKTRKARTGRSLEAPQAIIPKTALGLCLHARVASSSSLLALSSPKNARPGWARPIGPVSGRHGMWVYAWKKAKAE